MARYLHLILTIRKRFSFFQLTFAIGDPNTDLLTLTKTVDKFGKALKNWTEKG